MITGRARSVTIKMEDFMKNRFLMVMVNMLFMLAMSCGSNIWQDNAMAADGNMSLGVDQLMKHVDQYKDTFTVEGVVSAVSPNQNMLNLIDTNEFRECGVTTCAALVLPVHYEGVMPSIKDIVRIKGYVKEQNGKLFVETITLEKLPPEQGSDR